MALILGKILKFFFVYIGNFYFVFGIGEGNLGFVFYDIGLFCCVGMLM